jgi:predicted N-acetyltransferase YhbS
MQAFTYLIRGECPEDAAAIDALHDFAFGPGRFARTAQRLRDDVAPDPETSLVAMFGERLGGSVRMTPIRIGATPAQLLGPLAVHPDFGRRGVGGALVRAALEAAAARGWPLALLVGDRAYYCPLGFQPTEPADLWLPGPVDPRRVLVAELRPGAAAAARGLVKNWRWG